VVTPDVVVPHCLQWCFCRPCSQWPVHEGRCRTACTGSSAVRARSDRCRTVCTGASAGHARSGRCRTVCKVTFAGRARRSIFCRVLNSTSSVCHDRTWCFRSTGSSCLHTPHQLVYLPSFFLLLIPYWAGPF
jgi:hypothetical protein